MRIMAQRGMNMEKEMTKTTEKAVILQDEKNMGVVQIADDVVAMIASLAATEVEGVSAMVGNITNELMSRVGVKDGRVVVDLAVTMEYGYNIPATCQKVQGKVKAAIENMTGLDCTDVNIRIAGVRVR